jgi:phosphoribosylaminoimidazolecarboxamide formyltransferase/IMP cyclohydrolase
LTLPLTSVKCALLSVSDKTGIVDFASALVARGVQIISTGGTGQLLREANIPVQDISDITGFAEMMDGRVKTLHPKIHGGILGLRDEHAAVAKMNDIGWIDLVVVNLYPFSATIKKIDATFSDAIENIDVGGSTMIRAAAKNMRWVGVVVSPTDYSMILAELEEYDGLRSETRQRLAVKAFSHTAAYDQVIHDYLASNTKTLGEVNLVLEKSTDLRYGENPHQSASAYQLADHAMGILSAKKYQGKQLSYNNIVDADAAVACVKEFSTPACVIVKHANPCGVATAEDSCTAFQRAYDADKQSAFGGVVALNQVCDKKMAEAVVGLFIEVLIAPVYTIDALAILLTKQNLRVLELSAIKQSGHPQEYKFVEGGVLIQDKDSAVLKPGDLKTVTVLQPTPNEIATLLFAWPVLKHVKSNAIVIAKNNMTIGIGAGQVSRIDAVEIALKKVGAHTKGAVLVSDAFFPFSDSIDRVAGTGIRAIAQPGGSVRDQAVIDACNAHNIAMVFTGIRCFKH